MSRLPAAAPVPAFNLKRLDGSRVSLDSLKGKIVVINFWGIWCGWCIHELPDYQKLYEKYNNDPDVVMLTIKNDQNVDEVLPWIKQKHYSFPVLLDDGFVATAEVTRFPDDMVPRSRRPQRLRESRMERETGRRV